MRLLQEPKSAITPEFHLDLWVDNLNIADDEHKVLPGLQFGLSGLGAVNFGDKFALKFGGGLHMFSFLRVQEGFLSDYDGGANIPFYMKDNWGVGAHGVVGGAFLLPTRYSGNGPFVDVRLPFDFVASASNYSVYAKYGFGNIVCDDLSQDELIRNVIAQNNAGEYVPCSSMNIRSFVGSLGLKTGLDITVGGIHLGLRAGVGAMTFENSWRTYFNTGFTFGLHY